MKLKSILRQQPLEILESILQYWNIQPPERPSESDEQWRDDLAEFLYPRLQMAPYFRVAFENLEDGEKELVYFLTIHGGDLTHEEVARRQFSGDAKALEAVVEQLTARGFCFLDDLRDQPENMLLVGVPEPFLRFIELPPYWEGYLGNFLKDVPTSQLTNIATRGLKVELASRKRHYVLNVLRAELLNPTRLRSYISKLPDSERELFRMLVERRGVCVFRDLLDAGMQKRYDHAKAEYVNNLLTTSGLVFTATTGENKYNNLLMVPRDIYHIIASQYVPDNRSLRELDTVSLLDHDDQPTILLENTHAILRDVVCFASYINRNTVRPLSNGGIGKNDLKKILPQLSPNKTIKYAAFVGLFLIAKKLLVPVGKAWRVSNSFIRWLDDGQRCYQDLYAYWLTTNDWNEEYVEGDVAHSDAPVAALMNMPEMRKVILQNIASIPHSHWINLQAFADNITPQIELSIPRHSATPVQEKHRRHIRLIVESVVVECLYWLGIARLGMYQPGALQVLGSRKTAAEKTARRTGRRPVTKVDDLRCFFKMTPLGHFVITGAFTEPVSLFEGRNMESIAMQFNVERFTIQPNLEILAPPDLRLRHFYHLNEIADIKTVDIMSTFSISKESLREAMDKGIRSEDIVHFFTEHSYTGLPDTVRHLIAECSEKHGEVDLAFSGGYIRVTDPVVMEALKKQKRLQEYVKAYHGDDLILLIPNVDIRKVARELQHSGYMPQIDAENVQMTEEDRFTLSLSTEEMYTLLGVLRYTLLLEETLGTVICGSDTNKLLERLRPDAKHAYNVNYFADSMSKNMHKAFEEVFKKSVGSATKKYQQQVTRLISTSPRATGKTGFDGPDLATSLEDIRAMIEYSLDRDITIEIDYRKANDKIQREEIVPEKVEGNKLTAFCETRDTYSVYLIERIARARMA